MIAVASAEIRSEDRSTMNIELYHCAYSSRRYGYWHRPLVMMVMMMIVVVTEDYGVWVEESWPTSLMLTKNLLKLARDNIVAC